MTIDHSKTVPARGGIGFLSLLTLLFVAAKLWGVITWSWWLVFLPVLIPLAIVILILVIVGIALIACK